MAKDNLALVIYASHAYLRNTAEATDFSAQNDILFSAISQTYLPLLDMLSRLEADGVNCRIGLVLPPTLCTLLDDPQVQKQYIDSLDRRIALGEAEVKRLSKKPELRALAELCRAKALKDKTDFVETYNQNLVDAFKKWAKKGFIELIATSATCAFLPHYADLTEALNAQIETGLYAQRQFFGESGDGFFLPYEGYASGVEKVLRSYGVNYTILDARSLLFSESEIETGIFAPVRTNHSLVLLASDNRCLDQIAGEEGYAVNEVYRAQHLDIGFDLDAKALSSFSGTESNRVQTLFKYWSNASDGENRVLYNVEEAKTQLVHDAEDFVHSREQLLTLAHKAFEAKPDATLQEVPCTVCALPAELMGPTWAEGVDWLEAVIRACDKSQSMQLAFCRDLIVHQFELPKVKPYPCAATGTGYGENLLDSSNCWMMRYVRKASERMVDLADRFPSETGLKARLLNIAARELLLAQCGELPRMVSSGIMPDVMAQQFKTHILAFSTVFDSLASNTVSTEWLTQTEKEHPVFPWINYRIFSRKK